MISLNKKVVLKTVSDYIIIMTGTLILAFGIRMFYSPNQIVTGGVTGIAIILRELSGRYLSFSIPLWLTNFVLNVPLFLISVRYNGKSFMIKSLFSTLFLSFALYILEFLPAMQMDFIITAIFGGTLSGLGLGMVFGRAGSTGGTDLAANIVQHFLKHISLSRILFVIDSLIIATGFFVFGPERAMYAVIAIFVSSKMIDFILEGIHFSKAAFIISDHSEKIAERLLAELNRGVTSLTGKGAYSGNEKNVILCVVSQKEIVALKTITGEIDKGAFVLVADVREVLGEGFKDL